MRPTTKLYSCCIASYPVAFHLFLGNSRDISERRKLIEFINSKNNNYLLMDRAYEDDKTIAWVKAHSFRAVIPPKKIINSLDYTINNFINNEILLNDISFV